ncbi:MAG: hypothetical protein AAF502_13200 [Bacteroidota bacterium]
MSKEKNDELFDLIHTMTKAEKRYFKVFFSNHVIGDQNKYMILYDYMARQEAFNWEKLERKFKGEKFIKHYSKTKGYLIDLILKSLRRFGAGKDPKDLIIEKLRNVRILYNKSLFSQSDKLFKKLKKYCYDTEEFNLLLEVLEFEHWRAYDHSLIREHVSTERFEVLSKIDNIFEFGLLYSRVLAIIIKEDNWVDEERIKVVNEILDHPLTQNLEMAQSLTAQFSYNSIHSLVNHLNGNYDKTCYFQAISVDTYEAHPVLLKANYKAYLLTLGNLVTMYYNAQNFEEMHVNYQRLLKGHAFQKGYEHIKFEQRYMFAMLLTKIRKDYSQFDTQVKDFKTELSQFKDSLTLIKETDIYFNIAIVYFERGMINESLDWVNSLLNHPNIEERQYLYIYTRAIDLLIHTELGNMNLATYKSDALYKYLRNHKKLDPFSKAVLSFVRAMSRHRDKYERQSAYSKFRDELLTMDKSDYEKIANDQLDYLDWLNAKLEQY